MGGGPLLAFETAPNALLHLLFARLLLHLVQRLPRFLPCLFVGSGRGEQQPALQEIPPQFRLIQKRGPPKRDLAENHGLSGSMPKKKKEKEPLGKEPSAPCP